MRRSRQQAASHVADYVISWRADHKRIISTVQQTMLHGWNALPRALPRQADRLYRAALQFSKLIF